MTLFRAATTRRLDAALAAVELIEQAEKALGGPTAIAGGFLLATAAAGAQGKAVGQCLAERWPAAELLGTSFEGLLGDGQVWRDEPALGLFVWGQATEPPLPFVFSADELEPERVADDLLASVDRAALGPSDLLLIFPDSTESPGLLVFLNELRGALGNPQLAGAAASGWAGGPALSWSGDDACPGSLLGLLVLGEAVAHEGVRVSAAGATRAASPWLEITACRSRWVDELDEEPPLDWVRRQLGLDSRARVEPHLDRLMARVRRRASGAPGRATGAGYEEQYLIGLDDRTGSISLPGEFERGDELALALPDADLARTALRASVEALLPSPLILQFACRARDEQLHGDRDLESALVAHHATGRATLGTLAPFQLGPDPDGVTRLLVYSTVLAALGEVKEI
jgi:small ligand-binding sensory domain FIST